MGVVIDADLRLLYFAFRFSLSSLYPRFIRITQLKDFASLQPLFGLKKLEFLVLTSTAISQLPHYRSWLISNIPSIRWLDYSKVKQSERDHASSLFYTAEGTSTDLARSIGTQSVSVEQAESGAKGAKTFEVEQAQSKGLNDEQKLRIRKAIEKAGTLEEIQRLKRMLADGFVPDEKTLKALGGK
jgi:U2 small nuclear ribonucleoprotein A'